MQGMSFASGAGKGPDLSGATIPADQLAFVTVDVRGLKTASTGSKYLDLELTICEGQPFEGRKVWHNLGDPFWNDNSEGYREMGFVAICRMLEAGLGAGPNNPNAYNLPDYPHGFDRLKGLRVAIRIGVEKGTGGYADKNKVIEFLSPNPESSSFKYWDALTKGIYNLTEHKKAAKAVPQQATGFGAGAPAGAPQLPGFAPAAPVAAPQGFVPAAIPAASGAPGFPQASPPMGGQFPQPQVPSAFPAATPPQPQAPQTIPAAGGAPAFPSNPAASPAAPGFTQAPGWMGTQR